MADKNEINSDGSCPFSVSDNLKIEAASYDLNLDGIIIRYGSTLACVIVATNRTKKSS